MIHVHGDMIKEEMTMSKNKNYNKMYNKPVEEPVVEGVPTTTVEPAEEAKVEPAKIGAVTCELLNVRKAPNKDSDVLEVIKMESKVTILDKNKEWYKVKTAKDTIGYCMKKFISVR